MSVAPALWRSAKPPQEETRGHARMAATFRRVLRLPDSSSHWPADGFHPRRGEGRELLHSNRSEKRRVRLRLHISSAAPGGRGPGPVQMGTAESAGVDLALQGLDQYPLPSPSALFRDGRHFACGILECTCTKGGTRSEGTASVEWTRTVVAFPITAFVIGRPAPRLRC